MTSEFDISSDSDWLEVSSGLDSDDNVSLSDQDSDHDGIGSANRSRRSSFSTGSSISGDVDAWEGFVSDSADEEAVSPLNGMYTVPMASSLGSEPIAVGFIPQPADESANATGDATKAAEEEKRVMEALDQSFVGTLTSSRSSAVAAAATASLHTSSTPTSIRDLRLSFPDPLTSSRDELNRSYEAVSTPPKTIVSLPELSTPSTAEIDEQVKEESPESSIISIISSTSSSFPLPDPGAISPTPVVQRSEEVELKQEGKPQLDIILYGTSSEIKWRFVQELIQTATKASGHGILNSLHDGQSAQTLRLVKKSDCHTTFFERINVVDRTGQSDLKLELDDEVTHAHASLAIVYVPTAKLPLLQWHTAFLPVLVPSRPSGAADNTVMKQAAEDDWDLLAVPTKKVLKLGSGNSLVLDNNELPGLKPSRVYDVLHTIGQDVEDEEPSKPLTEKIKSMNAVTLFGLLSIVAGFAFNTAIRPTPIIPTPTVNSPTSNSQYWSSDYNRSAMIASSSFAQKGSSGRNTLEELALSVYDAHTTSISITSPPSSMSLIVASSSKAVSEVVSTSPQSSAKCGRLSKSCVDDKSRASTDIVAVSSSPTALSVIPKVKSSLSVISTSTKSLSQIPSITKSLSASVTPSSTSSSTASSSTNNFKHVADMFDATTKVLNDVVSKDIDELVGAADELLSSIYAQTETVIRQSKGKARAILEEQIQNVQNLNEEVISRNEKAKKRARDLKAKGKVIMETAKEELKGRTEKARQRARELKKSVVESGNEAWKTYEKAQEEWESVLSGQPVGNRQEDRKNQRRERRQERKDRRDERKEKRRRAKCTRGDKENTRQPVQGWRGFGLQG